ncbi:MAG TPA: TonB-dependent receptor [Burkholderiaceae bacterium]
MKTKLTPIAAAAALALAGAVAPAFAQTADAPAPAASAAVAAAPAPAAAKDDVQRVEVTGIRASLQSAINQKRIAETHVDVISAEDIGKMPDKNVADSLARVPGVTILNSPTGGSGGFDERDRVGLRGTNPSLTQTLLDGHAVANGDWFVLDQTGAGVGRSVSFSLLPSELVSRVEVHKNSVASDIEGGTAGSVNIVTRKPLEFSKQFTLEGSLGAVYADLPKKTDPQASVLVGWHNESKTFGFLVQGFDEKRHLRRDGVETFALDGTKAYPPVDATTNATLVAAGVPAGTKFVNLMGEALFTQDRNRKGGSISVELKPTSTMDFTLSGFSSKMDANNYNRNFMLVPFWSLDDSRHAGNLPTISNVNVQNGILTSVDYTFAAPTVVGVYDLISRKASASTNYLNLDGSWNVTSSLKLSGNGGVSNGEGRTGSQDVWEGDVYGTGGSYQLHGSNNAPSFGMTLAPVPAGKVGTGPTGSFATDWIFGDQDVDVKDKDTWGQIDAEYSLDSGMLRSLKFGLRGNEHKRYTDGPIIAQGPNWGTDPFANPIPASDFTQSYPSNFGSGLGGSFPSGVMFPTPAALAAYDNTYAARPISRRIVTHEYSVKEQNQAAYVQGNLEGEAWSGNVGVRVVNTKETSLIWAPTSDTSLPGYVDSVWAAGAIPYTGYYQTYDKRSYTDVLPSASIRIDVTPKVVARFALSKTMTRPDYTALSSAQLLGNYSDPTGKSVGSGSTGNPDLNPVRSTNVDANLEYYFAPRAFVSVGAFHMEMSSYITDGIKTGTYTTDLVGGTPGQTVTAPFALSTSVNMKASVTGMEFAVETPIFENFGVSANYTLADAHDDTGHVLKGAVKNSGTVSGYYENDMFSARINYNYSGDNYLGRDRGTDYFQRGVGVVSASLGLKFGQHLSFSLDAQNLNDPILKYYGDTKDEPRAIYRNGRQFYLSAHFKY